jgi:hypothetical protein
LAISLSTYYPQPISTVPISLSYPQPVSAPSTTLTTSAHDWWVRRVQEERFALSLQVLGERHVSARVPVNVNPTFDETLLVDVQRLAGGDAVGPPAARRGLLRLEDPLRICVVRLEPHGKVRYPVRVEYGYRVTHGRRGMNGQRMLSRHQPLEQELRLLLPPASVPSVRWQGSGNSR